MSEIIQDVYLGSLEACRAMLTPPPAREQLDYPWIGRNITHVITVDIHDLPFSLPKTVQWKAVRTCPDTIR